MRFIHSTFVLVLASALVVLGPPMAHADPDPAPVGDWQGTLEVPGRSLRFVLHVEREEDGTLSATLDSPDQGDFDIPTGEVTYENDTLTVRVPHLNATYQGQVRENVIDGVWSQHGRNYPLELEPMTEEVEVGVARR